MCGRVFFCPFTIKLSAAERSCRPRRPEGAISGGDVAEGDRGGKKRAKKNAPGSEALRKEVASLWLL